MDDDSTSNSDEIDNFRFMYTSRPGRTEGAAAWTMYTVNGRRANDKARWVVRFMGERCIIMYSRYCEFTLIQVYYHVCAKMYKSYSSAIITSVFNI